MTSTAESLVLDSERAEVFAALTELAARYPHWRIGQLVANVAGWADAEVWDVEDERLLCAARVHLTASSDSAKAGEVNSGNGMAEAGRMSGSR